jgi:malonyl-CoA/methylmalonyl-CoA synthetase
MANLFDTLGIEARDPDRIFAVRNGRPDITYGDLIRASGRYANALIARGVQPGDRVTVQVEKCIEMLFLYLGCLRAGAVFLPANPAYTPGELGYILDDATPALVVCTAAGKALLEAEHVLDGIACDTLEADGRGSLPDLAAACPADFTNVSRADDDLAAILYTSGTTGRPKGAMLTHGNLASNALTLVDYWRFDESDRLLHALPIFHTHGLFVGTNVTLAAGSSMLFLPRFDLREVVAGLAGSSVMMGVPTFYIRLLGDPAFGREQVASMRLFVSGSAPLSADVHREFAECTGHAVLERYGMTETNMNTSNPYDGERRAGTVGFPLPGVEIRITNPSTGEELGANEVGMIEIAGPNVFAGYWNMPERTAEEFRGRFFVSGDLGLIDDDGYVQIVGRGKDLIISGGLNVYPAEVETVLDELDFVRESAVIGVPHHDLGEGVVAVVAVNDRDRADEALVLDGLRSTLARYKQPKRVMFVDELPRNAMGKIQKAALRERFNGIFGAIA